MDTLRTPDSRFDNLPGYDFAPHYCEDLPSTPGLRVHYLDEGPRDAEVTWLCLHGQPTWSYLYRRMIPVFVAAGQRVVAPDFLGFGRSDKPLHEAAYSFDFHRQMLIELVDRLALERIRLVCQDWGGLIGLTLPMAAPQRYAGLLVMNTALGTGDLPLGDGFLAWRAYARSQPDLDIAALMKRSTPHLSIAEAQAYAAPFPDVRYKAGVRRFPELVPDHPEAGGAAISRAARDWWRASWSGPSLMAIGMQDPVLGPPAMRYLHQQIRHCPPPLELAEAGHFVQEWGEPVARAALVALSGRSGAAG
ncbi:MAG: alpha/beta fold hydrolase [Betaproteobacteria bacterium]|nr:alpha/beta fold hydrolase [Betaproteobacteria bacterium]